MFSLPVLTPEDLTTSYVQFSYEEAQCVKESRNNDFSFLEISFLCSLEGTKTFNHSGGYYLEATPVPIPNTEVKLNGAEDT